MKTGRDVARRRLDNLLLGSGHGVETPVAVVERLAAVQAQDFAGARWAIGMRLPEATDASVDAVFDAGQLLRVHVLRPTWHAVLPADVRWLQALTAERVKQKMASNDRALALDGRTYARSQKVLARALAGATDATRDELRRVLADAGIEASGTRLLHILMRGELDLLVCSGPRRGKQPTYALLDERAPPASARKLDGEAARTELARRYLAGHSPAQLVDLAWWSGFTSTEAKAAIAALGREVMSDTVEGKTLLSLANDPPRRPRRGAPVVHLLPNFDELTVAYRDRRFTYDETSLRGVGARADVLANHLVACDGEIIGGWRRAALRDGLAVELRLLARPAAPVATALESAAQRLGRFLAQPARISITVVGG